MKPSALCDQASATPFPRAPSLADERTPMTAGLRASGGMIVREKEPVNLEMPFGSLDSFITPVERFFVRCHHSVPQIDVGAWRLKIEGEVENPLDVTYAELAGMETRTISVTMECAGNGRAFLAPQPIEVAIR